MKKKKITAIMAVIMMAAGLSACSQSNAKIEGKSGIVKDEASKRESDTGTSDPIIYVQEPEYVDENDIISTDDTATIDGISYKIDSYEHTTEFGNRNKDTVAESLKDSYEGNIDENYNLSNGYSYIFVTMTYTNNTDEQVEISRNAGAFYIINDDLERLQDEASKRESDTGTSDPIIYVQEPEYVDENDIISTDDTATIDGISYKIDSYEHTTEFGNRNKDTVAESLKDSYEGNIDENYNLSNGYSYIFVTMTYTNNTDEQVEISRNAGAFYIINDDLERLQVGDPGGIYIDNYWTEGKENERYHYVLGAGESVTSEVGYIIQDEWMSEDSKYIYYCIEGIDSKTNDKVQKYFKLEL